MNYKGQTQQAGRWIVEISAAGLLPLRFLKLWEYHFTTLRNATFRKPRSGDCIIAARSAHTCSKSQLYRCTEFVIPNPDKPEPKKVGKHSLLQSLRFVLSTPFLPRQRGRTYFCSIIFTGRLLNLFKGFVPNQKALSQRNQLQVKTRNQNRTSPPLAGEKGGGRRRSIVLGQIATISFTTSLLNMKYCNESPAFLVNSRRVLEICD